MLKDPCRELSNGGLGIAVALLVCRQIDFSCVSTGGPIQLYARNTSSCLHIMSKQFLRNRLFVLVFAST